MLKCRGSGRKIDDQLRADHVQVDSRWGIMIFCGDRVEKAAIMKIGYIGTEHRPRRKYTVICASLADGR